MRFFKPKTRKGFSQRRGIKAWAGRKKLKRLGMRKRAHHIRHFYRSGR